MKIILRAYYSAIDFARENGRYLADYSEFSAVRRCWEECIQCSMFFHPVAYQEFALMVSSPKRRHKKILTKVVFKYILYV